MSSSYFVFETKFELSFGRFQYETTISNKYTANKMNNFPRKKNKMKLLAYQTNQITLHINRVKGEFKSKEIV